jgi:hypothetical protein
MSGRETCVSGEGSMVRARGLEGQAEACKRDAWLLDEVLQLRCKAAHMAYMAYTAHVSRKIVGPTCKANPANTAAMTSPELGQSPTHVCPS